MVDDVRSRAAHEMLVLAPTLLAVTVLREIGPAASGDRRDDLVTGLVQLLCIALYVLARRSGLPWWASAVAAVLVPLSPPVVEVADAALVDRVPFVAGTAVVGALVLLLDERAGRVAVGVGAVLLGAAGLASPAVLVALAGPALVLWRRARGPVSRGVRVTMRAGAVAAAVAVVAGLGVVVLTHGHGLVLDPLGAGPVASALSLVAVGGCLLMRRVRPLALTGAALLLEVSTDGRAAPVMALLAAGVTAVLATAAVDGYVRYGPTRLWGHDVRRPARAVAALAVAGVVLAVVPGWGAGLARSRPVPSGATVAAPSGPQTVIGSGPTSEPGPSSSSSARPTADPGLARAGVQLATNPALRLSGAARADLEAGRVDPRVLATLATVAGTQTVDVDAFPPADASDTGLLRTVRISGLDGGPADRGTPATADLLAVLDAQRAEFHPLVDYERTASGAVPMLLLTFPLEDA